MSLQGTILRRLALPAYERIRGRGMLRHLAEYDANQWLDEDALKRIQCQKLQALLQHCWLHVPYYRRAWAEAGVGDVAEIRSLAEFEGLPLLTKQDVRDNLSELAATTHQGGIMFKATSGSTGSPLRVGFDRESYDRRVAVMHRGYGWAGVRLGERVVYLWGGALERSPWRSRIKEGAFAKAFNRLVLETDVLDDAVLRRYVDAINRFKPDTIVGFTMPLEQMARCIESHGLAMHKPARILSAAEKMHAHQRQRIELAFGAPVYDTYGCREVMLIGAECTERQGLHVNADHLVVECIHRDGMDGSAGDVVLTDLHNYGMPMVRYMNGDVATMSSRRCSCGRGLPLMESVAGRLLDALVTPDGRLVAGERIVSIFMGLPGVLQYQAVQTSADHLDIRIVPGPEFQHDVLTPAEAHLRRAFGDDMHIHFDLCGEIPLGPGGKRRVSMRVTS